MTIKKAISLIAIAAAATMAKDYSGAELYTLDEYMYGKYEARMYMGATSGTISSMFLYHNGSENGTGPWVEVDIEVLGKNPNSFQSNIITGRAGAQITSEEHHSINPAANAGFHTYGLEWTPNYVRWTVDGVEVRKTEGGQVSDLKLTQGLRFNLWSHEDAGWVGPWDDSKLPIFQFINWVKAYKYTPGQGENGSDFTLDWTDNFDTFDGSRWGKGNWSFEGNRVDLTENNIYSRDGMLILALTKKGQEMFNGVVPQDNESAAVVTPSSSSEAQQANSSSATNPWEQQSSSSVATNPWEQPTSSAATPTNSSSSVNPWEQPASSASEQEITPPQAIQRHIPAELNTMKKDRGTFNAKGERINKSNASRYRVDFDL